MIVTISVVLGGIVSVCILIGMATKMFLLPYLKEHLVNPIQETHRQMTVNNHTSPEPTLLDRIDDKLLNLERSLDARFENMNNLLLIHIATGHGNAKGYSQKDS